jgi:hypothetical protein
LTHPQRYEAVSQVLRSAGVPEAKIAEAYGKAGEFLGRGQLRAEIPFTEKGIDILPTLTGKEHLGDRAIKAATDPVLTRTPMSLPGGGGIYNTAKEDVLAGSRMFRGQEAIRSRQVQQEMEQLAQLAPADQARRVEIVKKHIDPDYDVEVHEGGQTVFPKDDFISTEQLSPQEQRWVQGMRQFMEKRQSELASAGVLADTQKGANLLTGEYYPRRFERRFGFNEELPAGSSSSGTTSLAARTKDGGLPMGRLDEENRFHKLRATADPHAVLPQYSKQASRAEARANFEGWLATNYGTKAKATDRVPHGFSAVEIKGETHHVPTDLHKLVNGTFDKSAHSLASVLSKYPGVKESSVGRVAVAGLDVMSSMMAEFKRNVTVKVLGFHAVNGMNDVMQMSTAGVGPQWLGKASNVIKSAARGDENAIRLLKEAQGHNIGTEANLLRDVVAPRGAGADTMISEATRSLRGQEKRLNKIARDAGGNVSRKQKIKDAAYGAYKYVDESGERWASYWRSRAELATFLARRAKGDSPERAAQVVADVLLDYGSPNQLMQVAKLTMPFANYMLKAPGMVAKAAVRNPKMVLGPDRLLQAMSDPNGYEPKESMSEKGPYVSLSPRGQQMAGDFREAMGGGPTRPGYGMALSPRTPFQEAMSPFDIATKDGFASLPRAAAMNSGPFAQAAIEGITGQDMFTKKEVQYDPVFGWPGRMLAPVLFSPMTLQALNEGIYHMRGGEAGGAPVTALGGARDYADRPEDVHAQQRMNLLTRMKLAETSPLDALQNMRLDPKTQEFIKAAQRARKKAERVRQVEP